MGKFQVDEPYIVTTAAQKAATIHVVTPRENIRPVMGEGYRELMETIARLGAQPAGPWFTHQLRTDPSIFELDIGVPVTVSFLSVGRVVSSELPGMAMARTIYHGDYERLAEAWAEFDHWMSANGYKLEREFFETYLVGPETTPNPDLWQTQLSQPVRETSDKPNEPRV